MILRACVPNPANLLLESGIILPEIFWMDFLKIPMITSMEPLSWDMQRQLQVLMHVKALGN
jgi:hypothetical protein